MFLLARYIQRPDSKQSKGQYDENISLVRKIKDNDYSKSNVILDLDNEEVIKCRLNGQIDNSFPDILGYFWQFYQKDIAKVITPEQFLRLTNLVKETQPVIEALVKPDLLTTDNVDVKIIDAVIEKVVDEDVAI